MSTGSTSAVTRLLLLSAAVSSEKDPQCPMKCPEKNVT